jgi:hypothetical protein
LKPSTPRTILVSAANTFGDSLYAFFNPANNAATQQVLILPLTDAVFPFSNLGTPMITSVAFILALSEPMPKQVSSGLAGANVTATFDLGGSQAVALMPASGTAPGGGPIAALVSPTVTIATAQAPASCNLSITPASAPAALQTSVQGQTLLNSALIADVMILITYELAVS